MDVKQALKEQYHASLAMLAECVEKCPTDLWIRGEYPRNYWRIVFHTAFFTQIYLVQDEASYRPWPDRPVDKYEDMWQDPVAVEPYELPELTPVLSQEEAQAYIGYVDSLVDKTVSDLNLDAQETGYSWYPNMSKLSHELMNLRHIQGHIGQLSELLMAHGIETEWISKR